MLLVFLLLLFGCEAFTNRIQLSYALSCFLYLIGLLKCLNITSWKILFVIRVHMVLIVLFVVVVVVIIIYCA